ncbi:MAG: hypothetical protein HYY20_09605 [Candidatus Tectomicrobia bacterium]|uniref:Uncharacterized protein n=1 Tax=Tectimicrobiota bacterium TaxID=2528274 RepID=A0A932FX30_UNCTE|nr:hypothetical protein [Candidatus Tectomicrobia bacterium]
MGQEISWRPPDHLYLYAPEGEGLLDLEEIVAYVRGKLGKVRVEIRPSFLSQILEGAEPEDRGRLAQRLAEGMAGLKVRNPLKQDHFPPPLYGEIEYEKERIEAGRAKSGGILYDGYRLQELLGEWIPASESGLRHLHLIFTCQLFGTWDGDDLRYHARTSVYGSPALFSTMGLVEAPAKPKDFYLLKQQVPASQLDDLALLDLKRRFKDRFIDYADERMTEVMKGYVLQAYFGQTMGNPFCEDRGCRLFNAHWQEEVIYAQLNSPYELCPRHRSLLEQQRKS